VLLKRQFSVKNKAKIFLDVFWAKDRFSKKAKIERKEIENFIRSRKMKNLGFSIFYHKFKLIEQRQNNVITTKKKSICFFKRFFL